MDLVFVNAKDRLAPALEALASLRVVGIDVERADWDRYWRAAALIQVGGDGGVVLIDPLAVTDLEPLQAFLVGRTAVLHAMENDLGPLAALGVEPSELEDTSLAAALLGLPTGLEVLLAEVLGIQSASDKQAMQRADWERRPLDAAMLAYAAADVVDLPALWRELRARLQATGRMGWYRQEVEALRTQPPVEERRAWTRTRGIGRLAPAVQARVRALWEARERLARDTDTAPGRILGDQVLVDLAASPVASSRDLGRRGMRRQAVRDFGEALLRALHEADSAPAPARPRPARRPTEADRARAERLRVIRAQRATELGIDAGVLCPGRILLSAVLTDPRTPEELRAALGLRPWQWEQLGPAFSAALGLQTVDTKETR